MQTKTWSLFFEQGSLVWGNGGTHPVRRWHRQSSKRFSEDISKSIHKTASQVQSGNYEFLIMWLLQKKLRPVEVKSILSGLLSELLFDLHQEWSQCQKGSRLQINSNYVFLNKRSLSLDISIDEVWLQAAQDWQAWQGAGLENYYPDQAPVIRDVKTLQQQVLPRTYQNLVTAINGNQTLRDLAAKSHRGVLDVAKSLLPSIQQGLVDLQEIEDFKPIEADSESQSSPPTGQDLAATTKPQNVSSSPQDEMLSPKSTHRTGLEPQSLSPSTASSSKLTPPLIAYIDDYKVDGQTMNQILTQMGYRLIHIQDPMQALPLLLEHKPKLIFLDLVMPIVNGYEACAQIRRMSRFKDTPIIILTSNDGIVDRVRAKIVGSTDFLSKPIEPKKIQMILQKYSLIV
ncbi:MAG TPA: response regulator [Leptolyngbyaceae cyanobacterium]